MPKSIFRFIRDTRSGALLVSAVVVLVISAIPVYFALDYRNEHRQSLANEAERHLTNRITQAQTLLNRARTIPSIVALTISQHDSSTRFEGMVRNLLAMSGIAESVSIIPLHGPGTVVHRDVIDQIKPADIPFPRVMALISDHNPLVSFGDGSLLIRESLSEVDTRGDRHLWGYLTAEASLAHMIQELQLVTLVNEGFGVRLVVHWQSGAADTVIFTGGDLEEPGVSRSIPLIGNEVLSLSIMPPAMPVTGLPWWAIAGLILADILLFLLTFHLLRRPQLLAREVGARTRELVVEKVALQKEVAARIEAESYLERSHALLDSIFEHIPGMVILKRVSDRRIARINRSAELMLSRSRDLLTGRSNEEIYAPNLADILTQGDIQALGEPGLVKLPVQYIEMPSSAPRWIGYSKTVLRDRDGKPQYILEFGEDLTERENAERRTAQMNRILTVLNEINHLIAIHKQDSERLLEEARCILQQKGGFPVVWIRARKSGQTQMLADESMRKYAESICVEIEKPQRTCGQKRTLHCQAIDCCNPGLSRALLDLGLQSLMYLPLSYGEVEWGDLGILGAIGQSFSDEEQSLLDELASNISFALDAIEQREKRRVAESELELSAKVFENNSEGILVSDANNRIVMVNKAFTQVTGYSTEEAIGKTPALLNSGRHSPQFYQQMWQDLLRQGEWRGEIVNRRKNGEEFPEWLTISQVRNDEGLVTHYVGVFSDLTERRRIEAHVDFLANYDSLTALPNREHFCNRLVEVLAETRDHGKRVAIIYLDLDRFKLINETVGAAAGDQLLIEVSSRLVTEAKSKLDVARLGGDQFAVLVPGLDSAVQAAQFAQRLQESLGERLLNFLEQEIHISASIGISIFPDDGSDAEILLRNADSAMYRAIKDGGNTHCFFRQEMNEQAIERLQIEGRLRHALERGELAVHFQPFVAAASGRIVGAEALLRWHCPDLGGQVSPLIFIPLLEEIGLIGEVGEWVLHQACAEARRWQSKGGDKKLFVAVNLSAYQLTDDLPGIVAKAIADHGITPDQLEIELTESAVMKDADNGIRILRELEALKIHLSIDDFGTGYSSLAYLKRLPMSTLKIDRSFVLDIPDDAEAVSITRAILALGHALHLSIIAEGVETLEQVEFLCHSGCDLLQGYYFSKPVSAVDFNRLLTESPIFALPASVNHKLQLLSTRQLHS